jgi:hypothetical protein
MRLKLVLAVCCALSAGCGSAAASDHHAVSPGSPDEKPRILSLAYGKVRPTGASRAHYALSIRTFDPDGQIVSWSYRQLVPHSRQSTSSSFPERSCGGMSAVLGIFRGAAADAPVRSRLLARGFLHRKQW